ncbi:hypothetical protein TWF730_004547 [Orbilia blumenaviensis]|uniref:Uncharacterized protein n=1 Tax=Orbilia blumenaviensis TaxID=1796055 RepID=A0AAV9TYW4_9PEZI
MGPSYTPEPYQTYIPPPRTFYPHPLTDLGAPLTYREQRLRAFTCAVRNKPNWTSKVLNRSIFVKWLREARAADSEYSGDILVWDSDDVNFVWQELNNYYNYVEALRAYGCMVEPDVDCVWRADGVVPEELRQELINAVATLENVPDHQKDWHPGSNGQVLDLVHPSLWPIIYGRSISLEDGKIITAPLEARRTSETTFESDYPDSDDSETSEASTYSDKFCWLPSEFKISSDGKETKIASYINNLSSMEQQDLFYPILEKLFTHFVPLFNHVLADLSRSQHRYLRDYEERPNGEPDFISGNVYDDKWEEILDNFVKNNGLTVRYSDFAGNLCHSYPRCGSACPNVHDNLGIYSVNDVEGINTDCAWTSPVISPEGRLEGRTMKVIVKLANIVLTPENPYYYGGSWHIEAMLNERIVSTGIYYYAQENITDSALSFRTRFGDVEEDEGWARMHGLSHQGNTIQDRGSIQTKEHRLIAFPNVLQHQVQPFQLIDPTKPGYRKILVFFLCDPAHDVPTTRTVAAQQPEERSKVIDQLRASSLGSLPEEVFQMVVDGLPPVISREEAETYRASLMRERSNFTRDSKHVQGREYNFCEH